MSTQGGGTWRFVFVLLILLLGLLGVLWRLIDLGIINQHFLLKQSQARILRTVEIPATRGMITDRFGEPIAISTPMISVWINPKYFKPTPIEVIKLADVLKLPVSEIERKVSQNPQKRFVYLKRRCPPVVETNIRHLKLSGIYFQKESRRYYPSGEVTSHVIGFTNIDDHGQEGIELAYDNWLRGTPGKKHVIKDRMGHTIAEGDILSKPVEGHNLTLSLDHRIQYLAYRALKTAVNHFHARSGSVVVLDIKTGEVLAMVNQPSYNPNNRSTARDGRYRNRAVTDIYEPGSVIKPFTISLALESGQYTESSIINTSPGWMWIGGYKIRDDGFNYGSINLRQVLQKSSNIGAAKIMRSLTPEVYWDLLSRFGFGQRTQSGFPGEASGTLVKRIRWLPSVVATLAYGYGIAVTPLQLAHAYSILANGGMSIPVTFVKMSDPSPGVRVLRKDVANQVLHMMESVVKKGGTGTRASIPGYRVAGKTGTAYIAKQHGYDKHRFVSSFVGIAPASKPRLVVAVMIRDPHHFHSGGMVAAPVFSKVMGGALRYLHIPRDAYDH